MIHFIVFLMSKGKYDHYSEAQYLQKPFSFPCTDCNLDQKSVVFTSKYTMYIIVQPFSDSNQTNTTYIQLFSRYKSVPFVKVHKVY